MTPERTLSAITHCMTTHNPQTARRILDEYVSHCLAEHEQAKFALLRARWLEEEVSHTPSSLAIGEEEKSRFINPICGKPNRTGDHT